MDLDVYHTIGDLMPDSQKDCSGVGHIYFANRKTLPKSSRRLFRYTTRSKSFMIMKEYSIEKVQKFIGKINKGL